MSFRPPELVIDPDDPFKGDTLGRKPLVETLCAVIETDERPLVVSVDGRFGSGKSTFLAMCAARLREKEAAVAEFNAWQQSHTKNPLIDLTAALMRRVPQGESLKRVAAGVSWGVVSAITHGAINRQNFQEGDAEPLFDLWHQIEEHRQAFHAELEKVVKATDDRLVIFVDELDRCMPQQALDYLNIVRHLFDVPGVAVVIGVNQEELAHRVRQLYGEGCNADLDLKRFWDFTMPLREPTSKQLPAFLNGVFQGAGVSDRLNATSGEYPDALLKLLVTKSGMSLRDIQQTVHYLASVLSKLPSPDHSSPRSFEDGDALKRLVLTAFAIRVMDQSIYDRMISREDDLFQVAARLCKKLEFGLDDSIITVLITFVLSLDRDHLDGIRSDEEFVQMFMQAEVGDRELAEKTRRMLGEVRSSPFGTHITLEHLDSLLSLTG